MTCGLDDSRQRCTLAGCSTRPAVAQHERVPRGVVQNNAPSGLTSNGYECIR
jgi:hypothetical protein